MLILKKIGWIGFICENELTKKAYLTKQNEFEESIEQLKKDKQQ